MDRRTQIIEAARDLFLQGGIEGMSMRRVAQRCDLTATALYRHFRDKDDLLAAVVDEGRRLLGAYLFEALQAEGPRDRLERTGQQYLAFALDHPGYFEVFFMSRGRPGVEPPPGELLGGAPRRAPSPAVRFLYDRIREAARDGLIALDPDDEGELFSVALHLWGHVHGLAALWISGGMPELVPLGAYRALCHRSLASLVEGL